MLVSGRVQGVAFRWHARDEARARGVAGWVRNLSDGRVEVFAEGERAALESFVAWLREGPPAARVTDVAVQDARPEGDSDFGIVR